MVINGSVSIHKIIFACRQIQKHNAQHQASVQWRWGLPRRYWHRQAERHHQADVRGPWCQGK